MKVFFLVFMLGVCALLPLVSGLQVSVSVLETIDLRVHTFPELQVPTLWMAVVELQNIGSIGYRARPHLVITGPDQYRFDAWGKELPLVAGEQQLQRLYWYPANRNGTFSGQLSVNYAFSVVTEDPFVIKGSEGSSTKDNFMIRRVRTRDNVIRIEVESKEATSGAILLPVNVPLGWIIEQAEIDPLEAGERSTVYLGYDPGIFRPVNLTFAIVSHNGSSVSLSRHELRRETGFAALLQDMIDWISDSLKH
ncbi:MAG: hypothetical protein KKA90_05035 [Nanoarchaeota archaeon]|nr:hypothetical protein [Nanoarchaeota archaeon]